MKSVDALRELVKRDGLILEGEEFDKCLDAIEEESRTRYGAGHNDGAALAFELTKLAYKGDDERYQFCRRVEVAANDRDDVTLFGVDYIALPVDADGVPIHVGDVMEWRYDNGEFEVIGIGGNTLFYIDKDSGECEWTAAGDKRHHHAPTVDDVLREFAYGLGVPVADSYVAATAAKLRFKEG